MKISDHTVGEGYGGLSSMLLINNWLKNQRNFLYKKKMIRSQISPLYVLLTNVNRMNKFSCNIKRSSI